MLLLVVICIFGAVASEPQAVFPMGYSMMAPGMMHSVVPISYSQMPTGQIHSVPAQIPAFSSPFSHNIIYPSLDITMGRSSSPMAKPMEETVEMKKAKMDLDMEYSRGVMTPPQSTPVIRARRDSTRILPYGYNLPYSEYMTPYTRNAQSMQTPPVLSSAVFQSPYYSHV